MLVALTLTGCFGGIATTDTASGGADSGDAAVATDGGLYRLWLGSDPAEPVAGPFTLHLQVADPAADDAPVTGASLDIVPFMPEMGHGISGSPDLTETGAGAYEAAWSWPMSGEWEVTIGISADPGDDTYVAVYEVQ